MTLACIYGGFKGKEHEEAVVLSCRLANPFLRRFLTCAVLLDLPDIEPELLDSAYKRLEASIEDPVTPKYMVKTLRSAAESIRKRAQGGREKEIEDGSDVEK
jgi:hypothetical protein